VKLLEAELGVTARIEWKPAQVGDVPRTWAETSAAREALGYAPRVPFEEGIHRFVGWLREAAGDGASRAAS
jgi:UDP-glucuronate 4-epimerase